jgi:Uma2 family endonuclease
MDDFARLAREADALGFRLEMVRGLALWEASPVLRHQRAVVQIVNSVRPVSPDGSTCACVAATDVQILFPDGSRKRPDVSVFRGEPEEDREITLLPEAVVEVLSRDYEAKDLVVGVPYYRQVGIKDVIVLDPETGDVTHWQQGKPEQRHRSPVTLALLCGCVCTV